MLRPEAICFGFHAYYQPFSLLPFVFISFPDVTHHFPSAPVPTLRLIRTNTSVPLVAQKSTQGIVACRATASPPSTYKQPFNGEDCTCARGINRGRGNSFLHHQDSRINLNLWTLQHCLANSTNSLFQRSWNQTWLPVSFVSLVRSTLKILKILRRPIETACAVSPAHAGGRVEQVWLLHPKSTVRNSQSKQKQNMAWWWLPR